MPKGLKPTSGVIVISSDISESAANTFTDSKVDLQLNVLDREVFVVTAIDLDVLAPDNKRDSITDVDMTLSTTERTTTGGINNSNVLAHARVQFNNVGDTCVAVTSYSSTESPHAQLEYIGIIATNDFYLNVEGRDNDNAKGGNARVWGYRAQADAATFSALTQSELLSA
jgi:hypothetical protein|tara:strand:- start:628 stop:1137 length:510 start_codon:yes stop_codon:yes gene_type:complete